jgi:ABC-2 type transport system ATP-binding protein
MPEPPPASVRVSALTKHYGRVAALRGVSFEVSSGEIFGLLGLNGAGKTTTLECLLGLRRPDSGTITLEGVDALAHPMQVRQLVGAQLQSSTLQENITPRQALRLFASFYRTPVPVADLIARFSLHEKADAPFDSLSGGQRQRLALALAFVNNPRLVVLDEPTAGLDPQSRRELHAVIAGLREAGRTVLLSTHYLEEAHQLCDRIAILHEGRIVAIAPPADLIAQTRSSPRLVVRTIRPLDDAAVAALAGVESAQPHHGGWRLRTADANTTIVALVKQLERDGNALLDLHIERPSLEDAFIALTGRAWSVPGGEEHA